MERPRELELWGYLQSQRRLAARLLAVDSLDDVAGDFLATVAELLRWQSGALWEVEPSARALRFVSGWSGGADAEPLWRRSRELEIERGVGLAGRAWERGEIAWAEDLGDEAPGSRGETAAALGLEGALAIPIPVGAGDEVLAVAEFHARRFSEPSPELLALLAAFADQLATFINRARDGAEAERARNHLAAVVLGTRDAVLSKDLDGVITSWNPAAERLYGYTAEEAIGRHIEFLMPPERRGDVEAILGRVRAGEPLETFETQRIRKDGVMIDVSLTVSQIEDPAQGIVGASVVARDITAEMRERRAQAFLAGAARDFDSSLDPEQTARNIVAAAIPDLAEVCVIDFVRADGMLGDSVVAAIDPEVAAELERIRREQPLDPRGEHPVAQALGEGRPMIWRDLRSPEVVEQVAQNEAHRELLKKAGYSSAAIVPMVGRDRALGTLSFLHARGEERYDAIDLEFLSELGSHAAVALDNALLFRERDRIARNLQRGLRPPQPAPVPGLEISVFFEAAGEGIEIGGDLYDVLPAAEGCWIVIGDVAGKGTAAAGVSVAVRYAVRGLTRDAAEPEEVLNRVNELLLEGTGLNDFATALLARLRQAEDGAWEVVLAAAGHPAAVHLGERGARSFGGGTVLGAWPDAPPQSHELRLEQGETLLLCTDGWFEAGPVARHRTPEELAAMAEEMAEEPLAELTERLRRDVLERSGEGLRDDVVLLAVRPTAQPIASRSRTVVPLSDEVI